MTRASLTVALLVVFLALVVVPGYAENAAFLSGVEAVKGGDYRDAITDLQAVVAAEPNNEAAWHFLGVAYYRSVPQELGKALEAFKRAAALSPEAISNQLYIGHVYEAQKQYDQALTAYQAEAAVARGDARAEALVAQGRLLVQLGRDNDAIAQLYKALDLDPKYVEALYLTGLAWSHQGDYDQAQEQFARAETVLMEWQHLKVRLQRLAQDRQRARGDTPEVLAEEYDKAAVFAVDLGLWPTLNKARGDAYLAQGKMSEARNNYRHALRRSEYGSPADSDVYVRLAKAYFDEARDLYSDHGVMFGSMGILNTAIRSAAQALVINPTDPAAYNLIGDVYAFQAVTYSSDLEHGIISHTFEDALLVYDKALQLDPNYLEVLIDSASMYIEWAQRMTPGSQDQSMAYEQARARLDSASKLAPNSKDVLVQVASLNLALEDYDAALTAAKAVLAQDETNIPALTAAGLATYYKGQLGEAVKYFNSALDADVNRAQSHTNMGNAFFQMQNWYRARSEYKIALDHTPTTRITNTVYQRSYLYYLTAITYHETEAYDQEIVALNQALALDPNYYEALRQMARAYTAKSQYRAAETALQIALDKAPDALAQADVQAQLGAVYLASGDRYKAVEAYAAALNLDPNNLAARETLRQLQG